MARAENSRGTRERGRGPGGVRGQRSRPGPADPPGAPHLGVAEADEQERQQVAEDKGAHHVGLLVALVGPLLPAEGLVADIPVEEALVVGHWRGHGDGQSPDEAHAQQRVAGHPQGGGAARVHDGHVAVHRHRGQREDADQHGHGEEVVDELADEGAQHPGGQRVHRGLEGDAEEQVGQVGDAQVEDEQVGGAARLARLAARQHGDHQAVAQHAEREDQAEHHQRDEVLHADAEERPGVRGRGLKPARVPLAEVPNLQLHGAQGEPRLRWRRAPAGEGGATGDPAQGTQNPGARAEWHRLFGRGHLEEDADGSRSWTFPHSQGCPKSSGRPLIGHRAGDEGPAGAALREERALSAPYQLRAPAGRFPRPERLRAAPVAPRGFLLAELRGHSRARSRAARGSWRGLAAPPNWPAPLSPRSFWSTGRALCLRLRRRPQGAAEM